MNAGQILVQVPVGAIQAASEQAPSAAVASPSGGREASAFAGILSKVTPRGPGGTVNAAGLAQVRNERLASDEPVVETVHQLASPVTLANLMAVLDSGLKPDQENKSAGEGSPQEPAPQVITQLQMPQNVVLSAVDLQIAALQTSDGRMPEEELRVAGNSLAPAVESKSTPQIQVPSAVQQETTPVQVLKTVSSNDNAQELLSAVSVKAAEAAIVSARQNVAGVPAPAEQKTGQESDPVIRASVKQEMQAVTVESLRSAPAPIAPLNAWQRDITLEVQVDAGEEKTATAATSGTVARVTPENDARPLQVRAGFDVAPAAAAVNPDTTPDIPPLNVNPAVRLASGVQEVQNVPITAAGQDTPKPSAPVAETAVAAPSSATAETPAVMPPVRPNLDAYFQTSARPVAVAVSEQSTSALHAEQHPVEDDSTVQRPVVEQALRPVRGEMPLHAERMVAQETQVIRQAAAESASKPDMATGNSAAGIVKDAASTASGEESGRSGNGFGNQGMSGQSHMAMSHQVKIDTVPPIAGASSASGEPLRTDSSEQIMGQVKDHLANREIRSGSEQIVIRLSPENLGELKMNLKMENQRLKVEIVAETTMVRDTLMKHSDSLKETLARQNITMESFDVSTGSNRQGATSQGQADWRELTRQRQYNAWAPNGGYRLDTVPEMPLRPVYQASTAHSMVDVHF